MEVKQIIYGERKMIEKLQKKTCFMKRKNKKVIRLMYCY